MSTQKDGPSNQNPSPSGPEAESDSSAAPTIKLPNKELQPIPGPGAPMIPDHQNIDSNPIDPRVF